MNQFMVYVIFFISLALVELLYFKVARHFEIFDSPNERSSHLVPAIRGGGIIFFIAAVFWFVYTGWLYKWLMLGITLVAVISFLDDIKSRPALFRILVHVVSLSLLFYIVPLGRWEWWLIATALIVCIGALNAFNFMDGINGITGIYALVNLCTFFFIERYVVHFTNPFLIEFIILSVPIFLFFNYRRRAVCFAGDVGAITMAYIQIFLLLQLISATSNFYWVIIFLVFGVDSVITIIYRLIKRENIFKPHRTHLYQYLTNEYGLSHRKVSLVYGFVQLLLNSILVWSFTYSTTSLAIVSSIIFLLIYLFVRKYMNGWMSKRRVA